MTGLVAGREDEDTRVLAEGEPEVVIVAGGGNVAERRSLQRDLCRRAPVVAMVGWGSRLGRRPGAVALPVDRAHLNVVLHAVHEAGDRMPQITCAAPYVFQGRPVGVGFVGSVRADVMQVVGADAGISRVGGCGPCHRQRSVARTDTVDGRRGGRPGLRVGIPQSQSKGEQQRPCQGRQNPHYSFHRRHTAHHPKAMIPTGQSLTLL